MKLSLSNGVFAKSPLEENLGCVKRLGFENMEFNMKCVEEEDEESVYSAKKLMDFYGLKCLTVHAATLHVSNQHEIPKALYYGKVSADFARKLSAPVLVVHSNITRKLPESLRKKFLRTIFGELTPYAKKLRVKPALENLSYASSGYGKNVAELEEILEVIGDEEMGVTLDFCHAEATGVTFDLLEKYNKRLLNVHLSNRAHKPFNEESSRLNAFVEKMREYGYDGPLTLELSSKCSIKEIAKTKKVLEEAIRRAA